MAEDREELVGGTHPRAARAEKCLWAGPTLKNKNLKKRLGGCCPGATDSQVFMLVFNPTPCPSALLDRYADPKPLPYERPISSSGQGSVAELHIQVSAHN